MKEEKRECKPKVLIEPSVSPEEADRLADEIVRRAREFRKVWQEFMAPPKKKSLWRSWSRCWGSLGHLFDFRIFYKANR